jgi:hypothetical protein
MNLLIRNLQNTLQVEPYKLQLIGEYTSIMGKKETDKVLVEYELELLIDSLLSTTSIADISELRSGGLITSYKFIFHPIYGKLRTTFYLNPTRTDSDSINFTGRIKFDWEGKEKREDLCLDKSTGPISLMKLKKNADADNEESGECIVDYYWKIWDNVDCIFQAPINLTRLFDGVGVKHSDQLLTSVFPNVRTLICRIIEEMDDRLEGKISNIIQTILGEGLDE